MHHIHDHDDVCKQKLRNVKLSFNHCQYCRLYPIKHDDNLPATSLHVIEIIYHVNKHSNNVLNYLLSNFLDLKSFKTANTCFGDVNTWHPATSRKHELLSSDGSSVFPANYLTPEPRKFGGGVVMRVRHAARCSTNGDVYCKHTTFRPHLCTCHR